MVKTEEVKPKKIKFDRSTIAKSEKKADQYLDRQISFPLPGFAEGDARAQENMRKIQEDYQGFISKLIDTSKDRAAKSRGFLQCHTVYEKIFTHMGPHLNQVLQLPAQIEEDIKNAEKFHTQMSILADSVNESHGCNKLCGTCCSESYTKKLHLVRKADENHEKIRKADLEKRKKEQTRMEEKVKGEIEEIKRQLNRDSRF